MDSTLLKQFNLVVNREKAKFNKRLAIFVFFLAISTILWFLIKLSHEYTTDLDYPVQLVNPPKGKVIVGTPPRTVELRVRAYGYTLLRYKFIALLSPLRVNLKGAQRYKHSDNIEYYLLMDSKLTSIVSQLSDDIALLGVQPDTLFFSMANVIDRTVSVRPDISATYANQHMLAGAINVKPQSVTITGPRSIVDTIYEVKTKPVALNALSESSRINVELAPIPQIAFSQSKVKVEIPVEKFTEIKLDVPLIPVNTPDNVQVILLPEKITVKCNVTVSKYFLLKPNQFRAVCNLGDEEDVADGKVRVLIEKHPDYVGRIDFQPKYVDFIIKSE